METNCPFCGSIPKAEYERFFNDFHCGSGYYSDDHANIRQSSECKDRQLAALAKENERLKEVAIKLSDDFHQDEPLAYLVTNFDTTMSEYEVFANEHEANTHASDQYQRAVDAGEPVDWLVYPLYASQPKEQPNAQ